MTAFGYSSPLSPMARRTLASVFVFSVAFYSGIAARAQQNSPENALPRRTDISSSPGSRNLSPDQQILRDKIRRALSIYHARHADARRHNPWEVMHWIVGYGVHANIVGAGRYDKPVNAIGWLCWNGRCQGESLLYVDGALPAARKGPRLQGHQGQFLAILAQSRVPADYPLRVQGREFQVRDLVEREKRTCQAGMELTFKLIGLAHYLPSDSRWKSQRGEMWTIERLIQQEIEEPIRGAPCGGTHRLMGLSYAVRQRERQGLPISGQFARARQFIDDYHRYTLALQNPDGSFSTSWFSGRNAQPNVDRRLQTSGHILEWMAYSVPRDQLSSPAMQRAADYVASLLISQRQRRWEIGPLGHALRSLAVYEERAFGSRAGKLPESTPTEESTTNPEVTEVPAQETNATSTERLAARDAVSRPPRPSRDDQPPQEVGPRLFQP